MALSISVNDFTTAALRRMLHESFVGDHTLPNGKKPVADDEGASDKDDKDDEESENDKLVALSRERGDSRPPAVTPDDLPDAVVDRERDRMKGRNGPKKA